MKLPKDWLLKLLVAGLIVAVAALVLAVSWTYPLTEQLPTTVTAIEAPPNGTRPAVYDGPDVVHFPAIKQAIARARAAGGTVETLLPERSWWGWTQSVAIRQEGADPTVIEYQGTLWKFDVRPPPGA